MISITNQPNTFTPASNPVIFQLTSSNPNVIGFIVDVLAVPTDLLIYKGVYNVSPNFNNGAYFNLSKVLENVVDYQLNPDLTTIASSIGQSIKSYRLKITERIISGSTIVNGDEYDDIDDKLYIWNAELNRLKFSHYNQDDYVMNDNQPAKFLTNKPNYAKQSSTSLEYLYYLNDDIATDVLIKTYYPNGTTYTANVLPLPESVMGRLSVSPKVLVNELPIDFDNVGSYTVALVNASGDLVSEIRTYKYQPDKSYQEPINLLWLNTLGGVDSFTFYNPRESVNVSKTTIKKQIYKMVGIDYTDKINGIYNPEEEVLNVVNTSTYKVISNPLSDLESVWLKSLIESKQVWIELDNGELFPISVKNTSYDVLLKKYNTDKLNRLELEFTASANIK
jgi:hypothetical protein